MNSASGKNRFPWNRTRARVSYAVAYYDAADRPAAEVDVGTNGSNPRPDVVPTRSDTTLVTSMAYNPDSGLLDTVTDPPGIVSKNAFDKSQVTVSAHHARTGLCDKDRFSCLSRGCRFVRVLRVYARGLR